MTNESKNGINKSYTYDGNGIRQAKSVNGVYTQHILDGANVVADVSGENVTKYNRGVTGLISSTANNTTSYYYTDYHGNVTQFGTTAYDYDAFGNQTTTTNDANPFRYCGEYYDAETGLIYLRARYYDSAVGAFVSEDPIKDGLNWYAYCAGNPVNFWDPWGRAWTTEDQAEYDRLISEGKHEEAEDFKNTITEATMDWNAAGDDVYALNTARYKAVVARQNVYINGYEDDFDYTHGRNAIVFLGTHDVFKLGNHAGVVIMVSEDSAFWNDSRFRRTEYKGKVKILTLGAGEKNGSFCGSLYAKKNRDDDISITNKNAMIDLYVSNDDVISDLIGRHEYFEKKYNLKLDYLATPIPFTTFYNSNSYAHGLLNAAGISSAVPGMWYFPGWEKPIPNSYFGD